MSASAEAPATGGARARTIGRGGPERIDAAAEDTVRDGVRRRGPHRGSTRHRPHRSSRPAPARRPEASPPLPASASARTRSHLPGRTVSSGVAEVLFYERQLLDLDL